MLIKLLYPSPRRSPDHALGRIGDSSIIPDLQELLREIDDTKPITLPTKALHNAFKYADTGLTIAQFVPGQIGQAARQIKSKMNPHARFQIAQAKRQDVKDVEIKRRKALRAEVVHALNKLEATD